MDTQTPRKSGELYSATLTLTPDNAARLTNLRGGLDSHLKQVEQRLNINIHSRGNEFHLHGDEIDVNTAQKVLEQLFHDTDNNNILSPEDIHLALQEHDNQKNYDGENTPNLGAASGAIKTKKVMVKPRGNNQKLYVQQVRLNDINFGIGPAGTGKTYLAVACAVESLLRDDVERILLVRPAVEAGEKLGFLPGDLSQKVDPYLRPLYDALYEMLGFEVVEKLIEKSVIEIAPLAYMRGRTLNNSFVILDESQNTTREQMKMFLTRIGFGSTAVITGDPTQIDLPRGNASGLKHAISVLDGVEGISFTHFLASDVVRHPIVQRIVEAYSKAEKSEQDD